MKKVLFLACALVLMMSSGAIASEKTLINSPDSCKNAAVKASQDNFPQPIDNLVGNFDNEIKFFFSDIDGTLIPLDKSVPKGTIPQSVIDGAKELQNAKIPLILITGRSSGEAKLIAKKIGINNQYAIGQQGAEIVNPKGVLIYEDGISANIVKNIISEVESFNKKNGRLIEPFVYVKGTMYIFEDFDFPYILDKPLVINSISDIGEDFTAIKVGLYCANPKKLKSFQKYLSKKYFDYNIVISADCYCDVSSKTATKGNAIKILSQILGVNLKNIATIGDTENDISMLKLLKMNGGLAIAVDNANSHTKENANYISTSVSDSGFLNAVKNVLKNNKCLKVEQNSFSKIK